MSLSCSQFTQSCVKTRQASLTQLYQALSSLKNGLLKESVCFLNGNKVV